MYDDIFNKLIEDILMLETRHFLGLVDDLEYEIEYAQLGPALAEVVKAIEKETKDEPTE